MLHCHRCHRTLPPSHSKSDIFGNTACGSCLALEEDEQWSRSTALSAAVCARTSDVKES